MRRANHRYAIVILSVCLLFPLALAATAGGAFVDDDGNIHEANIDFIASLGITNGCSPPPNPKYCPDDFVTRAQMASFIQRTLDLPPGVDRFDDDDGSIHEDAINAIAAAGITKGCDPQDPRKYCPDDFVTRAQMATFIIRSLGNVTPFDAPIFTDVGRGGTHPPNINALAGLGITKGCQAPPNPKYCPGDFVTRAEMASFLARMIRLGDSRPPTVGIASPPDLSTHFTQFDSDSGLFSTEITFEALAIDPNGDTITSFRWVSSVDGFIGTGNPNTATLAIPSGQTSSQPFISVIATDSTGLFSGDEIQIKLIMPSP
ncbi:MAG TPA: S-layer homology domain-containing protein [Acidimicrobiia bacterium]|nr:S-layer homology domain-containing protein [Acidimicrobiia bacterium]